MLELNFRRPFGSTPMRSSCILFRRVIFRRRLSCAAFSARSPCRCHCRLSLVAVSIPSPFRSRRRLDFVCVFVLSPSFFHFHCCFGVVGVSIQLPSRSISVFVLLKFRIPRRLSILTADARARFGLIVVCPFLRVLVLLSCQFRCRLDSPLSRHRRRPTLVVILILALSRTRRHLDVSVFLLSLLF